jgi:cation:H+ antiporter
MAVLLFAAGLIFLVIGAEALVRGASRLAATFGISPLIIGLTVVAFGTSSPELAVSVEAALSRQAGIALGNVIGSNIFNVLFILGVSALIVPLVVSAQLVRLDVPLMILVSLLVLILALDGQFGRVDGSLLVAGLVAYVWVLLYLSRKGAAPTPPEFAREFGTKDPQGTGRIRNLALVIGGLALLVLGSRWLVDGAVSFARYLGVSELIVGLTIVAAGTSLPEVVTSIIAALRGERDIAVGNNIFNILGVLGIASVVAPDGIEVSSAVIGFDIPIMIAVALACLPIFFTGGTISRTEGVFLLAYYVAYTAYLILAASQHDALPRFSAVMLEFVIPITAVTMFVLVLLEVRNKRRLRQGRS